MTAPALKIAPRLAQCGPYELLVRIGRGGMASVYLARRADDDSADPKLFALKILHPELGELPQYVDMLLDEAKIASSLAHRNVVSTLETGRDEHLYYLVMDYVEGAALDRLLRRSPHERRPELIVPLAIDALHGLHAAHRLEDGFGRKLDLVHRDVTPGNLLVGRDGVGRITDFGVAKARARITRTQPGIVKGKAGYMAPEIILGREVDGRADVFSMGVLLWTALTGQPLFERDNLASSLASILRGDVPAPSRIGLRPSPLFDAPILTALAIEPDDRHESALEMADALSDALLMLPEQGTRADIGAWVYGSYGDALDKRQTYARQDRSAPWDADDAEPLSVSAMVRKDPTGRVVDVIPSHPHEEASSEQAAEAAPRPGRRLALYVALACLTVLTSGMIGALIALSLS